MQLSGAATTLASGIVKACNACMHTFKVAHDMRCNDQNQATLRTAGGVAHSEAYSSRHWITAIQAASVEL